LIAGDFGRIALEVLRPCIGAIAASLLPKARREHRLFRSAPTPDEARQQKNRHTNTFCEPDHTWKWKSHASSNGKSPACLKRPLSPLRRTVMEHSLKRFLVIVALGAVAASPAFARSELDGRHQRFARPEPNGQQQRSPRDANMFITNDRNLEGYPRPAN
jgi:hypothetical protein